MRSGPALWMIGAALILEWSPAQAQVQASVETGLGGIQYQGNPGAIASLAPSFAWSNSLFRLSAEGAYTGFGDEREGTAGRANASLFGRLGSRFIGEAFGSATGQSGPHLSEGAWLAGAKLHYLSGPQGLWLGSARGAEPGTPTWRIEAGYWRDLGPFSLQLQAGQTMIRAKELRTSGGTDTIPPIDTVLVNQSKGRTDLSAWVRWARGAFQLGLGAGRHGNVARPADVWWESEAALWISPRFALVGAAGDRPTDLTLGMTGGRFLLLSIRANLTAQPPRIPIAAPTKVSAGFRIERLNPSAVEFSLPGRGAHLVELMADFTDWKPVPLEYAASGWWRIALPVSEGIHQVNVRFDGGAWEAPPGVAAVADDFGGVSGRIVVQ
jgi:hypothetical protein